MRFLDLDLDFFLNKNAYASGLGASRLGAEYQPWSTSRVRRFLEDRCGLSTDDTVPGKTFDSHEEVLWFWRELSETGRLPVPFEVIHIDAHPDMWVGGGLYRTTDYLHLDPERELTILAGKPIHSGNYLTFALAYGWISSLIWVPLLKYRKDIPPWDADARALMMQLTSRKSGRSLVSKQGVLEKEKDIPFKILPWNKFKNGERFEYMALSRSPGFTPPESDGLIAVIESYMKRL
jgi:hypothetical protein